MPEHLDQIELDTGHTIKNIYEVLEKQETTFTPFSEPGIEKCTSKEVDQEALHLCRVAWLKLFTKPPQRWVVFRSTKEDARIGTQRDQFVIPIQIPKTPSYITDKSTQQQVELACGCAVFCAAGKPAAISDGVLFLILSP
ncbi:hypothetical protein AOQ84DRAFT_376885 [Glonium stellatum]|uniref:Uncharacterized protein n=1 Tax=Glonium stellatum TaxID=574774 RepID=A0A8E2JT88_9PEZI|nr:hypothetical protein AOQ84DRAFT_376885 [Glonium stellatum]